MIEDSLRTNGEWRAAWPVVLSGGLGYGATGGMLLLTAGLFVQPMRQEFGWSASAATLAPVMILVISLCFPLAGLAIDRWGSRLAAIVGTLGLGAGLATFSFVPGDRSLVYVGAGLLGVVASLCYNITFCRGVATWFRKNAGLALGLTLSGSSVVTFFALPAVAFFIANYGWRAGYLTLAAIVLIVGLPPVLLWFRESPRHAVGQAVGTDEDEGVTLGHALRDRRFWFLLVAMVLAAIPLGGFLTNLHPILIGSGLSIFDAAQLGMVYVISILFGRVVGGYLLDRIVPRLVPVVTFILAAIGAVVLGGLGADSGYVLAAVAVALVGMGHGAESDFIAFFTVRLFGTRSYSSILGIFAMSIGLSMALGGTLFALASDLTGNFHLCSLVAGGMFIMASLAMMFMPLSPRRAPHQDATRSGEILQD